MYTIRAAEKKDLPEVERLTEAVFNDTFVRDVIEKEEEFNLENVRLLFDESGKLASTVFIIPREMFYEGAFLKLGGIGGVATDPLFRGKGYANFLMKDAVMNMKKRNFDISILYPFKSEYYAKFGYRDVLIPFGVIKTDMEINIKGDYEIKEINSIEGITEQLEKLYNEFCVNLIGPVKRSKTYWQQKFEKNKWLRENFFVAIKNGKIVAYLILDRIKKNWPDEIYKLKITECVWEKEHFSAVDFLIKKALKYVKEKRFDKIFYDRFFGFDLDYAKMPSDEDYLEHKNLKFIKMYKILNLESLLLKISNILNSRAGDKFNKIIEITHSEIDFQGKVKIKFKKSGNIIECDEGDFTKILLGLDSIIRKENKLNKLENELLNRLFPEKGPVFWDFDYL